MRIILWITIVQKLINGQETQVSKPLINMNGPVTVCKENTQNVDYPIFIWMILKLQKHHWAF